MQSIPQEVSIIKIALLFGRTYDHTFVRLSDGQVECIERTRKQSPASHRDKAEARSASVSSRSVPSRAVYSTNGDSFG